MTLAYNYYHYHEPLGGVPRGVLLATEHIGNKIRYLAYRRHLEDYWTILPDTIGDELCQPHPEPDKIWAEFVAWRLTQ